MTRQTKSNAVKLSDQSLISQEVIYDEANDNIGFGQKYGEFSFNGKALYSSLTYKISKVAVFGSVKRKFRIPGRSRSRRHQKYSRKRLKF